MTAQLADATDFSTLMRTWRQKRGYSQLQLALDCNISQKHISFLESARSAPSRTMVLTLCTQMDLTLRVRNEMLLSAGLAPEFPETTLSSPNMAAVDQALTMMMHAQEPYPAFVLDPLYNLLRANTGAIKLQMFLFGAQQPEDLPQGQGNMLRAMFHPDGVRPAIKNFDIVAAYLLDHLETLARHSTDSATIDALIEELVGYANFPENWRQKLGASLDMPLLTLELERDGVELNLFSTITTLGTPLDVTLSEIRIESYFPANEATKLFFTT